MSAASKFFDVNVDAKGNGSAMCKLCGASIAVSNWGTGSRLDHLTGSGKGSIAHSIVMYPLLSLVARRVFGIMPTSVDAERLCSAGALTFSDLRGKLSSSKAAMLIFLSFALRAGVHMPAGWSLPTSK
jgi:hypothetical protein